MISTGLCRWILILLSVSTWTTIANSKEMRVVCYYTNWSVYRPGAAKFTPQNINPYLCTHLIYAFGGFTKDNTLKPFDKYQDIEKGGYAKFTGLKTYNKNLKTMLAIGGWNEGSSRFSPMVASVDRRKELIRNAIKFLRQNHFDGLDLDWEYPSFRDGGKPRDRDNYAQFVQELREEFERESQKTGRPRLLLTMAVPAGIEYINKGYDVPKLTKYLDWMNILSYDYHSAFEPAVNHHAPLYSLEEDNEYNYDGELNIDYTIKHYLKMGAEPSKLVLGIPTYGRSYTLFNPDSFEIGSPADGPGTMGEATRENGYLAYYEICEYVKSEDWEVDNENPKAMGPYAFKDNQWVGYDDENIARVKAEYVAENGLGGIMFWAIDNDDFRGTCHGKPYPLIEAAKEALLNAYGITDNNLISPTSKPIKSRTRSRTKTSNKINRADEENETKIESTVISRRRNRFKTKSKEPDVKEAPKSTRRNIRRKDSSKSEDLSTHSSLKIVTPSYTTPPPPATPDMGGSFKCEDEGFFPNPKDCKKYFWCLSGAGDSGIVAHQFTCPAGLYFNKAADSCDYSQNVLCNKKLQKATTSTTTSTTESSTTSTDRPVTTTRSIFRTKTTTEAYEEEEYEYDEDDSGLSGKNEPEEDPQVIKELIDLIKKAGGIEELEKQLNPSKNVSSSSSDTTTQSAISKALYEKVLSKSGRTSLTSKKNTYSPSRNSGGSQSAGLDDGTEKDESHSKNGRGKLQYTSISRNRPSTTKSSDESNEESSVKVEENGNESRKVSRNTQLEYVNIRRSRTSTTTEASDTDSRNKILGEVSEEEEDETEDEENESDGEANKRTSSPQYVNIRRQRPSTTEWPTTSKYLEIKRGTTEVNDESEGSTSKYKTIRRGTTSPATSDSDIEDTSIQSKRGSTTTIATETSTTRRYINFRRGTTEKIAVNETPIKSQTVGVVSETGEITAVSANPEERTGSTPSDGPTVPYTGSNNGTTDNLLTTERQSTTIDTKNSTDQETSVNITDATTASENITTTLGEVNETSSEATFQKKRPQLLDPRPFSIRGTTSKPIIDSTTHTAKVSESNIKLRSRIDEEVGEQQNVPSNIQFRSRSSSRFNFNRNSNTDSTETGSEETAIPKSRRRLITSTEKIFDDNRTFRPSELADLSSLTAVDFANVKELNFNQNIRRRRIRPTISSISTTSTENSDDTLRTSSRTLPLARVKLLSASKFGKGRRVVPTEQDKVDTQTTRATKTRGYRATREPISTESIANIDLISSTESINFSPRNRRIIRRFRTTAAPKPATEEVLFGSKSIESLTNLQQNKVDEDSDDNFDDSSNEEGENIKLSESNIRENSDVNSFGSNLRGNKKVVDFHNKASIFGKDSGRGKVNAKDILINIGSTEPNFTSRTRKIVRKILPTQTTTTEAAISDQGMGRRRKIIRRLRPTTILNKVADEYVNNLDKQNSQSSTSRDETKESRKHLFRPKISEDDFLIYVEPSANSTTENIYSIMEATFTPTEDKIVDSLEDIEPKTEFTPIMTSTEDIQTTYDTDDNTETILNFEVSTEGVETEEFRKHIFRPTTTEHTPQNISDSDQLDDVPKRIFRPNLTNQRNRYIRYKSTERNISNSSKGSFRKFNRVYGFVNNNTDEKIASTEERTRFRPTLEQQADSSNRNNNVTEEKVEKRKNFNRQRLFSRISRTTNPPSTVSVTSTESTPIYSLYTETPTGFTENVTESLDTNVQVSENLTLIRTSEATAIFVDEEHSSDNDEETTLGNTETNEIEETSNSDIETETTYAMSEIPSSTEKLQTTPSSSPRTRNNFRNPKERPSFIRSKFSRTDLKDDVQPFSSTPRYRKFSRVTTSELSSTKETIYTYSYKAEDEKDNNEETENPNSVFSTGYSEMTTVLPEIFTTELTPELEDSKASITEMDTVSSNILDSTTAETEAIITTESSPPNFINEISTGDDNISTDSFDSTTINIEFKSDPTATLDLDTTNETSTPLMQTTSATFSTAVAENTTTQSTERSTAYQRKSTFKSINARPKFSPKKLKDLNIARSTEPTSTKFKPKRFRNRLQESSTESGGAFRINRFSTTERTQGRFAKFSPTRRTSTTPLPLNKFLYKYSSSENYEDNINNEENVGEANIEDDEYIEDDENENIDTEEKNSSPQSDIISSILQQSKTTAAKSINRPYFAKKNTTKIVNKPKIFTSTTLATTVNDALSNIDTEAVKNRNKYLFSKTRKNSNKLNVAISTEETPSTSTMETENETVTDAALLTEETTNPILNLPETTEFLTTLHHVFAEVDGTTTEMNKQETTTNKIERLIEVNRIVNFETKEAIVKNHTVEVQTSDKIVPVQNKIGEVSRVTVIKVVDKDGNVVEKKNDTDNEIKEVNIISPVYIPEVKVEISTTNEPETAEKIPFVEVAKVEEIPAKSVLDKVNLTNIIVAVNKVNKSIDLDTNRDDRKIDLFSGINFSKDINKYQTIEKLDIIDGKSHINVFTPRPLYNTEASTIALEALFKITESPSVHLNKTFITSNDELLETDHSKFVNVRVLHPDENVRLEKNYRDDSKVIPIKLLKQDDGEVTLKAQVVEVTPRSFNDMIKIIPIRVEMSRQIVNKLPIFRVEKQNVPPT